MTTAATTEESPWRWALLCKLVLEGKPFPKIDWQHLVSGVGILTPMDKESQTITQEIVGWIKVADNSYWAWAKGDKDKYTNLTLKLPSTMTSIRSGKAVQIMSLMKQSL